MGGRSWLDRIRALTRAQWLAWFILLFTITATLLSGISYVMRPSGRTAAAPLRAIAPTRELFLGIPQNAIVLGDPDARVTLIEFADLQCPFCARMSTSVLPQLIQEYVRPGRVKFALRILSFIGPDSERAARMASAMAMQNHLWEFVHLFFENQGGENTGYATDRFLGRIAGAIPNVDVLKAMSDRDSPGVDAELQQSTLEAKKLQVTATPAFFLQTSEQPPKTIPVSTPEPAPFERAIDEALKSLP